MFFCFLSFFLFFVRWPEGIFCLFLSVSLCFSLAFFGLPLFQFFFLCLSLSIVLLLFFSSCLSFLFSFGSLFLPLSFLFFLPYFCFMKKQHANIKLQMFFHQSFLFLFFFLFSLSNPFSYLCFSLISIHVFCSTSMFLVSKQTS